MFAAVAIGIPAPLGAGHILWINLITDSPGAGTRHGWKRPGELDASAASAGRRVAVCRRRVVLHAFTGLIAAVTLGHFSADRAFGRRRMHLLFWGWSFHAVGNASLTGSAFSRSLGKNPLMLAAVLWGL